MYQIKLISTHQYIMKSYINSIKFLYYTLKKFTNIGILGIIRLLLRLLIHEILLQSLGVNCMVLIKHISNATKISVEAEKPSRIKSYNIIKHHFYVSGLSVCKKIYNAKNV